MKVYGPGPDFNNYRGEDLVEAGPKDDGKDVKFIVSDSLKLN